MCHAETRDNNSPVTDYVTLVIECLALINVPPTPLDVGAKSCIQQRQIKSRNLSDGTLPKRSDLELVLATFAKRCAIETLFTRQLTRQLSELSRKGVIWHFFWQLRKTMRYLGAKNSTPKRLDIKKKPLLILKKTQNIAL